MSMIGRTLGSFECTALLGKGGMGEVYKAKDQKLGRDVAIKVLPEEFAKDADRVTRFQREAKLLASLNHPNIAAIHGLEESSGTHFLVLELIEGDTLADRIKSGPIPVEESLKLALQIAEALEAAHEKGVIHRDLKPANIKITPDGKVKVLDFGLAKAFAGEQEDMNLSNSPTLSAAATQQGIILGTAAYMSPEQARGKPVDKRTDIWAFGVVLYEMLTGKSAFQGEDVSVTLASVIKGDTNLNLLPPSIHPRVREVITRCLQNDIRGRYSGIADARYEIEHALSDPSGLFVKPVAAGKPRKKLQLGIPWIAAAIALTAIIAVAIGWNLKPSEPRQVTRFYHELPEDQDFTRSGDLLTAVSADGTKIVYVADSQLYLRKLNELNAIPIQGTNEDPGNPLFSPDGQWVGYYSFTDSQWKKIPVGGGTPVTLCDASYPGGATWGTDGTILFAQRDGGTMSVSENGGTAEPIIKAEEGEAVYGPQMLPGGEWVLFTVAGSADQSRWDEAKIVAQSLQSGERKVLVSRGSDGRYVPTGHIVYARGDVLYAIAFDIKNMERTGGAASIVEGVSRAPAQINGTAHYGFSDTGMLVYVVGSTGIGPKSDLVWVDRDGNVNRLKAPSKAYVSPRVSPDGTKLAVQSIGDDSGDTLWIYDLTDDREIRQLTFEGNNYRPVWTPDSKRIAFSSDRDGATSIYWMSADGSGGAERLTAAEDNTSQYWPDSWSPDGKTLAYTVERQVDTDYDICLISPGGEEECIYDSPNTAYLGAQFSPDGRWIAYAAGPDAGQMDVYVAPFPPTGIPRRITQGGRGLWPMWSPNGREIFYRPSTSGLSISLKAVDITTSPEFTFRRERTLPIEGFSTVSYYREYDINPDGTEFLMTFPAYSAESSRSEKINVVLNWFEELKERVPTD